MSGLEAFSLACNIMTVITFALDTAKVCRTIRETGSSDKYLQENTDDIERTLNDVHRLLQQQPTAPTKAEINLRNLATKCMKYNEDIQKELKYISPKDSTRRAAINSTFKTIKRRSHIEELKSHLEAAQKTMDSALSVQILDECMKSKALNLVTYSTLDQQHKDFLANYKQVQGIFAEFDATKESQAYETLLKSLRYKNMNDRKNSIPQRHKETFEWIFENLGDNSEDATTPDITTTEVVIIPYEHEKDTKNSDSHPDLVEWLRTDANFLYWVSGKPGSGKSTFMKFIEQDQRTKKALESWYPQCNIISHFLWKPGTDEQQSLRGLLCSLLHQVLANERPIAIQLLAKTPTLSHKRFVTDWDIHDLTELLFRVLDSSSCANLVLLDGLDELSEPHGGVNKLFHLLNRFVAADRVKLCVSSRPEPRFGIKFASNPSIRMQDLTRSDIRKYTADFLKDLQLSPEDELYEKIQQQIGDKAEGVFIWVYLVLRNVKSGIEDYAESWDDIYHRIVKLPPDLMALYKDMWSRLSGNNEKYIKKAARYFQYVRSGPFESSIAFLSLIANDEKLEALAAPDESPCADDLIEICEATFKTLLPVAAGLLEAGNVNLGKSPDFRSESERKVYKWESLDVQFIHRTASDFVESAEGKELFARYTLNPEGWSLLGIKAEITLRSATRYQNWPLFHTWFAINVTYDRLLCEHSHILPLVHQYALNESRGLVRPPYSISYQNFFLFEASYFGFHKDVVHILESSESRDSLASVYVVIGACCELRKTSFNRYGMIRDQLKIYLRFGNEALGPPVVRAAFDVLMIAWRCFLLHEISRQKIGRKANGDEKPIIKEILEIFIKAGVMAESPGAKYLIAAQTGRLKIVKDPADQQSKLGYKCRSPQRPRYGSAIYTEVNDAFLLQLLSSMIPGTSELIHTHVRGAFMQPILANNGMRGANNGFNFFKLTTDAEGQESSKDWIFGGELRFDDDLFADKQPDYLQVTDIGGFSDTVDALEKINYEFPAVNRGYDCLHTWIN
ncbi:hypothetical protein N7478_010798 [Penicillium angulare]|uniref:uncharacterized protein n=1 Tax=Penicillium angulare TaxID=116970 RepID=UPI0025409963|nr:uncharacterized protein N7478_010798 [Penicillium angulare]KAJ5263193.1 hypothetical protein N7478_010798 [Penicillium angulare]